jgi:hypothetical protein
MSNQLKSLYEQARNLSSALQTPDGASYLADQKRTAGQAFNIPMDTELDTIPRVERNIDELEAQSRKLLAKATKEKEVGTETRGYAWVLVAEAKHVMLTDHVRRAFLLAGRGFDTEKVSETLDAINIAETFEPLQPLEDTDVEVCVVHCVSMLSRSRI